MEGMATSAGSGIAYGEEVSRLEDMRLGLGILGNFFRGLFL